MTAIDIDVLTRFFAKIRVGPDCWEWTSTRNGDGYGRFWTAGKGWMAHRFSKVISAGKCGPELDHICRNRICVRPSHLREVTHRENVMAPGSLAVTKINAEKTHCPLGHPLETYAPSKRRCFECERVRSSGRTKTPEEHIYRRAYRKRPGEVRERRLAYLREYSRQRRARAALDRTRP